MTKSAMYCERRSHAMQSDQEHLFTKKTVITNRRTKTKVVFVVCRYCGRKASR